MDKFMHVASKISSNKYLGTIRDAFIMALPLTLAASFAVLINNVLLAGNLPYALGNPDYWGADFIAGVEKVKIIFNSVNNGSLGIITFLVILGIPFILSQHEQSKNSFGNALIVFGAFYAMLPSGDALLETPLASFSGARNLFTALIVGLAFTKLLLWLQTKESLEIKLPDQVPPAVARAFSSLIPAVLIFFLAGLIVFFFTNVQPLGHDNLSAFITAVFQQPFFALAKTNIGGWAIILTYVFFNNLLWTFGLHGPNVLSGFTEPTLGVLQANNMDIYARTGDAYSSELAIFTTGFTNSYVTMGGSGATLALIIAIFFVSKREDHRAIAKLSALPGLFQINEPVIFGIPVVLNPIFMLPFVLAPLLFVIIPGVLTTIGFLPKPVISVPWVTPPIIYAFLATGGSIKGALVALVNLCIGVAVYIPFVVMANKQADEEQVEIIGDETEVE